MTRVKLLALVALVAAGAYWVGKGWLSWPITNAQPSGRSIVAFGDSLTFGRGTTPGSGQDYPAQLSRLLGVDVLNRGVEGETAEDALRRLDGDVLAADPRIVIVWLGGNDMLRHRAPSQLFEPLEQIVSRIQDKGALVVLVGLKNVIPLVSDPYGPAFKELARRRGCVYVANGLGGIIGDRRLMSDQVHPNGEGYKIIAQRVAEAVRPYVK